VAVSGLSIVNGRLARLLRRSPRQEKTGRLTRARSGRFFDGQSVPFVRPQIGQTMFEQAFKNIDDVLRKEAGCTTELDYTEQTSWLLFLKYLDGLEQDRAMEAGLDGRKYAFILDEPYRWDSWAAPKAKNGRLDHNTAMTGDDFCDFVNRQLFPYLTALPKRRAARTRSNTRSGRFSARSETRSPAGTICARSSTTSMNCASARRRKNTSCRRSTKRRSSVWATPGATAANTTPRAH
ncbi:MAG: type I restriction-modification system subunit M N-terminal domain-containing protein, partial [Stellaceae bacterium]